MNCTDSALRLVALATSVPAVEPAVESKAVAEAPPAPTVIAGAVRYPAPGLVMRMPISAVPAPLSTATPVAVVPPAGAAATVMLGVVPV